MLEPDEQARYRRHILLKEVGAQGQQALLNAHVLIVGLGGLGSPALQYLAAAGVGRLTLVDPDTVDLANLQRQTIYASDDIGASKAAAAAEFVRRLNPSISVDGLAVPVGEDNASNLVADCDLVLEGVDSFAARRVLNRACMMARTPLLSAAIGRFDGQLSLFTPYAGDLPCYGCLVPQAPPRDAVATCAEEGVLGPLAGVIGSLAALEVIKTIVGFGEGLAGRLLVYDGLSQRMRNIGLPRDPACPECRTLERPEKKGPIKLA